MSLDYYTILTNKGIEYEADCISTSSEFHITHIAVGDGNGIDITPNASQSALVHEIRRYAVQGEELDIENGLYYAKIEIPATDGGFTIRELGGYNSDGDLVMVANFPATVKRTQTSGEYKRMFIRMDLSIVNSETFPSIINPNLAYYNSEYIDNLDRGNVKLSGNQTIEDVKTFAETIVGNIDTADKLKTPRTISFTGAVTGSGSFDGSSNLNISTTGKSKTLQLTGAVTGSATINTGNTSTVSVATTIAISDLFALINADFTRGEAKAINTLHTAETDGFVRWVCNENDSTKNLYINDIVVARVRATGGDDACGTVAFLPVAKGSTYKCDKKGTSTPTLHFYPLKGV